jgi:hypothetical protein
MVFASGMNAVAMICLAYIFITTIGKEDAEKSEHKDSPSPITLRQALYSSMCIGFAVIVMIAINYYSKKYIVEMGVFNDSHAMMRLVSLKPFFGHREMLVPLSQVSTTSLPMLQQNAIGTKKSGDYLYLKLRGSRGNLLLDLTTEDSYLNRGASIQYLSEANRLR